VDVDLEHELGGLAGTFLGDLDFATLTVLLMTAGLVRVARGAVIEDQGLPRVVVLLTGNMRVFVTSPDGRQLTVRYVRSGGLVGTRARLAGQAVSIKAQALTEATFIEIDPATWDELGKNSTSFNHALTGELTRRLEGVYRAFAMSSFGTVRERLAAHLLDTAEPTISGSLIAPLTHRELAEALGTAREVVTRALRDLQGEAVLGTERGGVEITNLRGLIDVAGPWWKPAHFVWPEGTDPQASFNSSARSILAIDGTGAIVYMNAAAERTFGWAASDLVGQPLTALLPVTVAQGFGAHLAAWLAEPREGPIGFGRTFHGRRADGSEFPAEITLMPARTATGRLVFAEIADVSWRAAVSAMIERRAAARPQAPSTVTV
jgi:CRP/FNR family transcriptional regulator